MKSSTPNRKKSHNKFPIVAMIVATIVLLIVVVRIILLLIPGQIPLDDFISLELSGYNTVGEAQIDFDYNSYLKQYGEEIRFKSDAARERFMRDYPENADVVPAAGWLMLVKVGLSQYEGLSNGDTITLKSNSADSAVKAYFNYVPVYDDAEYVVEGLKEPQEIDILEDMTVTFEGFSPAIKVSSAKLPPRWSVLENLVPVVSKTEHLAEGEIIEVSLATVDGTDLEKYLATCGYAATTVSRTFEVSGDGHYITGTDEIPEDIMEQLQERSEDIYTTYLSTKNGSNYSWTHDVNYINYMGSLLLNAKDGIDTDTQNTLYLVYEASTYITAKPSAKSRTKYKNNAIWYFVTKYDNATLSSDDICNIDPLDLELVQVGEIGFAADDAGEIVEIYYGYASIDDVTAQLVTPYAAIYDCENRIVVPEETENNQ